jgi:hypothetical protein
MLNPTFLGRKVWTYDIEVYPNWYCCVISDGERFMVFRPGQFHTLKAMVNDRVILAGFNNHSYDDPIMSALLANPDMKPENVLALSAMLINETDRDRVFRLRYSDRVWFCSIDVFQILNGKASLKEFACREGSTDVREAPFDFNQPLPAEGINEVVDYCKQDVANTTMLLHKHWEKVALRAHLDEKYQVGKRIYCLPEQGIAQAVMVGNYRRRSVEPVNSMQLRQLAQDNRDNHVREWKLDQIIPAVSFDTEEFQRLYVDMGYRWSAVRLNETGTAWALKNQMGIKDEACRVQLAGREFQIGVGGLHSIDFPGRWSSNDEKVIIDLDVTSYYPSIIINRKLEPAHWDGHFSADLRVIRDERVAAKRAGDKVTAEALKIVINSTFGKLNDFYSPFRSVPDALRVCVGGQMYLLRLIELLHMHGARVLSVNTDGVTVMWERATADLLLSSIVQQWESETGFELERNDYAVYARRDVNNYVAITDKGKVKTKGAFCAETGKGDGLVIKNAAIAALTGKGSIVDAMTAAKTTDFVFYQKCKNGGSLYHGEHEIGKLVRWVVVHDVFGGPIRRKNPNHSWANLPNADSASLCLNLRDIDPLTINTDWYCRQAHDLVESTRFAHKG